jgi:hypothetical protein
MPDTDTFPVTRGRTLSRLLPWARDNTARATTIGAGLLLLGTVLIALPPHSIVLGVLLGLPSVLILTAVVSARAPKRWFALFALLGAIWCVSTLGIGVDRLLLQVTGHVESCQFLNLTEGPEDKYGGVTYTYEVGCPDGTHTFQTGFENVPVNKGMIRVRTSAGGLFGVTPVGQSDLGLFFAALPGPVLLLAPLVIALRTPRPANSVRV